MSDWARREIKIFSKKQDKYGCMCAESALKAFLSLYEDGHSGFSWSIATKILTRLMNDLPLTQIEDKDFLDQNGMIQEDPRYLKENGFKSVLQCKRMTSLFRYETKNGKVTYIDVGRTICYDEGNDNGFSRGVGSKLVDKMFPIKMPYYPPIKKYVVMFRNDKPIWIRTPEGEKVFLSDSEHLKEE